MNQNDLDPQPIPVYSTAIDARFSHPKPRALITQPDGHKMIPLTKGQVALVDNEDYERLSRHYWQARWSASTETFYAQCAVRTDDGRRVHVLMHRMVLGIADPSILIDHKDRNRTLDNRKANLRIATRSQNGWNSKISRNNRSGMKGIYFHAANRKWIAQVGVNGRNRYLGSFLTKEAAVEAYRAAAEQAYGAFSNAGPTITTS